MVALGRSLIQSMNGMRLTVKRSTAGTYVNGVWVATLSGVYVMAAIQPAMGADIMRLPEGDRTKKILKLYSADELLVHSESGRKPADIVIIGGVDHVVMHVETWPQYWKALVARVEQEENSEPVNPDGGSPSDITIYWYDGGTPSSEDDDAYDGGSIAP